MQSLKRKVNQCSAIFITLQERHHMAQAITIEIDEASFESTKQKMFELYQIAESISDKIENTLVKSVEVIKVEDGDALAVMVKGVHSQEMFAKITKELSASFLPKVVKVHVFNADVIELKVIRAE